MIGKMKKLISILTIGILLFVLLISGCDNAPIVDTGLNTAVKYEEQIGEFNYHSTLELFAGRMSDHTLVDDELWAFYVSDDKHEKPDMVLKYKLDLVNKEYEFIGKFQHNFGHCNTVDYCGENDTLILGNGGGADNEQNNQIYIIENVKNLKALENGAEVKLSEVAKIIDLNELGLDFGKQVNVCWGESNRNKNNIIYVLSNKDDIKYIYKIILGKGRIELDHGNLLSVNDDEFNGTFKILNIYTKDYSYTYCNQGTQYYKGKLYEALGHDSLNISVTSFYEGNLVKSTYFKIKYYNDFGEQYSRIVPEGIAIRDDYLFLGCADKDTGNKILIYNL